jgi:hypothetical protein
MRILNVRLAVSFCILALDVLFILEPGMCAVSNTTYEVLIKPDNRNHTEVDQIVIWVELRKRSDMSWARLELKSSMLSSFLMKIRYMEKQRKNTSVSMTRSSTSASRG